MKVTRLAGWLLVAVFPLAACNFHDDNSAATTTAAPNNLPSGPGSATLSWDAPTTTTAGAALTNLSGYRIYYGHHANDMSQTVQLNGTGLQTYVIDNLAQGTWYFAIKAVTSVGSESQLSNIVTKTIS